MSNTEAQLKTSEIISVYGILIGRAKHEGTLYWTRFGAFFLVVSGLTVGWFQQYTTLEIQFCLALAGSIATTAWALVSIDGALWQEFFVRKVKGFERSHSQLPRVHEVYNIQKLPDVVFIAVTLAIASAIGWLLIVFLEDKNLGWVALCCDTGFIVLAKVAQKVAEQAMEKYEETAEDSSNNAIHADGQGRGD